MKFHVGQRVRVYGKDAYGNEWGGLLAMVTEGVDSWGYMDAPCLKPLEDRPDADHIDDPRAEFCWSKELLKPEGE